MKPLRLLLLPLIVIAAQGQTPAPTPDTPELSEPVFRNTVTNILAPTLVTDKSGNIVDGIKPAQFHLFDNGKEQNIQVDVSYQPISVVLAIEASARVESIIPQIKHLGSLMPLILGERGEAAVMAFDSRLRLMQDFTTDSDKVKAAIDRVTAGNSSSRMIDTVDRAVFMLRKRPVNNRKIVLLITETRDVASEGRIRESLINAQLSNVLIYTVDISQIVLRLTQKNDPGRPDPIEVTARSLPMGTPATPTSVAQAYGSQNRVQFTPLLKEIYTDTKKLFVANPTEVFTKGTGGGQFSFMKQKGLEDAIQRISLEIRSQYLISYRPNNSDEPGYHEIVVTTNNSSQTSKTRPGYWLGGGKQ